MTPVPRGRPSIETAAGLAGSGATSTVATAPGAAAEISLADFGC